MVYPFLIPLLQCFIVTKTVVNQLMQDFVYPRYVRISYQRFQAQHGLRVPAPNKFWTKEMKAEKQYWYQRHEKNAACRTCLFLWTFPWSHVLLNTVLVVISYKYPDIKIKTMVLPSANFALCTGKKNNIYQSKWITATSQACTLGLLV